MALQLHLSVLPPDVQAISPQLALAREDGCVVLCNAGGPIYSFRENDAEARRLAVAVVTQPSVNLATPKALAAALGIDRSMVFDYRRRYEEEGAAALRTRKTGPKGPHKLHGAKLKKVQAQLDKGASNRAAARAVEVSEGTIRQALKQGRLKRGERSSQQRAGCLKGPRERNEEDRTSRGGVAVKRHDERALTALGYLSEGKPSFEVVESVAKAGVLLALPTVVAQGLYQVGKQVYGALKNGYFGLDAVLSTLVFMALLRVKSSEQLPSHAPGEFGLVLGLDRSPEMKTLRRKLAEMARREQALTLKAAFAHRWAVEQPELLGFLYVDGHVRPYNGRKHSLPKTHVPRRRLCMPATTDYWVNDAVSDPLLFVTAPANEGLLAMLENVVLPDVRKLVGPKRRVTLIMDRECWSPKSFKAWSRRHFDVMTYRKGRYESWPEVEFTEQNSRKACGKSVVYKLAERPLYLSNSFEVREVRCLTDNGHQTSIVTTRSDLSAIEVAERMFSRWRQENYFRYMRHEFALDHLTTHAVEPADPKRLVPNPAKKEKKQELDELRSELGRLKQAYGESALENSADGIPEREELRTRIEDLTRRIERRRAEHKELPKHVPVDQVRDPDTIVQLEQERKALVDQIKMVAYRAETELANFMSPLIGDHHGDEARCFLRQVFQLPADIVPDTAAGTLLVRPHSMANWRSNRALRGLCAILNSYRASYPGTNLRLVFEAPPSEK